jgi:hypothetical protein
MLGKIAGIGLVVLLVGALIGGGAYILTQDNGNAESHQAGSGRQNEATGQQGGNGGNASQGNGGGGNGGGGGRAVGNESTSGGGYGGGANTTAAGTLLEDSGRGNRGQGGQEKELETEVKDLFTIVGTVVSTEEELVLQTDDGEVVVGLGPEWYREAQSYAPAVGDEVEVTGFYEGENFEVVTIENLLTGETLILREPTGRPLWAGGRGRWSETY